MLRKRKANPLRTLERKQLKLWSKAVKERANNRCEWCGKIEYLNSHHIISKRYKPLRFDLSNGIALCPRCHKFGIGIAAHENPLRVFLWLKENRPTAVQHLIEFMDKEARGTN